MTKTSKFALILAFLVVIGSWVDSSDVKAKGFSSNHSNTLYPGKITIGMETWPGYLPLFVAQAKGYFRELGLDVDIKRYIALGEVSKDYVAGKLQGRANLTLDAVNEHLDGLDHRVVLAIDYSNGSDAIIARKEITTVSDFAGKRVGYEPNTLEEFFVSWALMENGLTLGDITPVFGNPEETVQQLKEGKADVAVSHEPFMSQVVASGDFHPVYTSADAPGLITDILTFRTDFVDTYPETVELIVQAYFKALHFWKDHPEEAYVILAKEFGDTPEGIAQQFKGITMLDEGDNDTAFTFAAGLKSLYGNMRQIGKFVRKHRGIVPAELNTDKLIETRFVKNLLKEEG